MKKEVESEIPQLYIERSPAVLFMCLLLTAALLAWNFVLFDAFHPMGFILGIPTAFFAFHTLWMFLNPFATFFSDRLEIRPSLFQRQHFYFIDVKKVSKDGKGRVFVTFKDDEIEKLQLFGVRRSQIDLLMERYGEGASAPSAR